VLVFPDQEIEGGLVALLDAFHQQLVRTLFSHSLPQMAGRLPRAPGSLDRRRAKEFASAETLG